MRFSFAEADIARALQLRALVFRGDAARDDRDAFDARCCHVLVEDEATGDLVCCFRMLPLTGGQGLHDSYTGAHYDLRGLEMLQGRMVELGRFCVAPSASAPDILRTAWGAMTAYVDAEGVEMLFGCSSFKGTDPVAWLDTLAVLRARHLAPEGWRPAPKSAHRVGFDDILAGHEPDLQAGLEKMPPLLRTYLMMGGRVSDHAVIDPDLGTLHVFTGVEIKAIPPARQRLLRALAA